MILIKKPVYDVVLLPFSGCFKLLIYYYNEMKIFNVKVYVKHELSTFIINKKLNKN